MFFEKRTIKIHSIRFKFRFFKFSIFQLDFSLIKTEFLKCYLKSTYSHWKCLLSREKTSLKRRLITSAVSLQTMFNQVFWVVYFLFFIEFFESSKKFQKFFFRKSVQNFFFFAKQTLYFSIFSSKNLITLLFITNCHLRALFPLCEYLIFYIRLAVIKIFIKYPMSKR